MLIFQGHSRAFLMNRFSRMGSMRRQTTDPKKRTASGLVAEATNQGQQAYRGCDYR
ncbi:hypothetical protein [Afipia sp. OHSU_I-C4]|uniref:hypothetical protein n=1 Tax=Afipia sp. OHSU_I-C4 TaxID=1297863 RepID=UPI001955488B|nr:hypothetical protein [Afipia sp. OHSU_I-C4]